MKKALLLFMLLLLAGAVFYLSTDRRRVPVLPSAATPVSPQSGRESNQTVPVDAVVEEAPETLPHTLRTPLRQEQAIEQSSPADPTLRLTKEKKREIIPGVTVEKKELRIQLEEDNESLHIRRAGNKQTQMLWKQKF